MPAPRVRVFCWRPERKLWHPETRPPIRVTPLIGYAAAPKAQEGEPGRREVSAPVIAPETVRSPITRLLGKRCFSCGTTNAVRLKFCIDCGAPLFRPGRAPASPLVP